MATTVTAGSADALALEVEFQESSMNMGEGVAFPDDQINVGVVQKEFKDLAGLGPLEWAEGRDLGRVALAKVSLAEVNLAERRTDNNIDQMMGPDETFEVPHEERKSISTMLKRIDLLKEHGVKHVMNIGVDDFLDGPNDELSPLVKRQLNKGMNVSWYSDGRKNIGTDGQATDAFSKTHAKGWVRKADTTIAIDKEFGHGRDVETSDLFANEVSLPEIEAGNKEKMKSDYGAVYARRLIEHGVRRVTINMTIGADNYDQIEAVYRQVEALQGYADSIGSETEVVWTFSARNWRPHQARGGKPDKYRPEESLQLEHMDEVNRAVTTILDETYERVEQGKPRIMGVSSGYACFYAEQVFRQRVVEQDVGYNSGQPVVLSLGPTADILLDPMFKGPELSEVRTTMGYTDRDPDPSVNLFSDFHHNNRLYLPNLVSFESREDAEAQPKRIMDRRAARIAVDRGVLIFGVGLMNKSDSKSVQGDPRRMLTYPEDIEYLGERLAHILDTETDVESILGVVTYGVVLGRKIADLLGLTFNALKTSAVQKEGKRLIEGVVQQGKSHGIVDDLVFSEGTFRTAVKIAEDRYNLDVTALFTIIDRQLRRERDGPTLEESHDLETHSLLLMEDLVDYMVEKRAITKSQLNRIIGDYRGLQRVRLPRFARKGYYGWAMQFLPD